MLSRTSSALRAIWKKMGSKKYRESFAKSDFSASIAAQIASMRDAAGWTQTKLATEAGMKQSRISYLEDPDFRNVEVATLQRIGAAFDVAFIGRFVPYSELAERACDGVARDMNVPPFDRDSLPEKEETTKAGIPRPIVLAGAGSEMVKFETLGKQMAALSLDVNKNFKSNQPYPECSPAAFASISSLSSHETKPRLRPLNVREHTVVDSQLAKLAQSAGRLQ